MEHHDQVDTLSLDTSVAVSGSGGDSTPEAAAGNSSYSTWSWEANLATVLDLPISDRSEVTGQPWLRVVEADEPDLAAHEIWSASWRTKRHGGAGSSLRVYLSTELYAGGGAWDRFSNVPAQALSGPATGLPLVPQSFQAAQQALASVTTGIRDLARDLHSAHHDLRTESSPFQGNVAEGIAEVVSGLHGTMLTIYDQLSSPSYSDAIGAAGDAATSYLTAIKAAYEAWSELPEHSPLGAVVQVLKDLATSDGSGGYTIPDPENTSFGDLTTPQAWTAVERAAKDLWMGPLAGSSSDFGGLDQLGRSALSGLVDQYGTTAGIITPVVGPAPPSTLETPVGGPNAFGDGTGPQGGPNIGSRPRDAYRAGDGDFDVPGAGNVLSGPIGATPDPAGRTGGSGADSSDEHGKTDGGFSGTVGRGHETKRAERGRETDTDRASGTGTDHEKASPLTAPAAGFSVGGGSHGSLVTRSAVPSVADKPPSVTSSQVNTQLTPGGTDGSTAFAQPGSPVSTTTLTGSPGGGPLAGPVGGPLGGPVGGSGLPVGQPGPAIAGGAVGPAAGQGAQTGAHGPMMLPPRSGTGGMGAGGQGGERRAYMPEDEGYWGAGPGLPGPADRPGPDEPDFDLPRVIVGIGAEADHTASQEATSNWRMR